MSEIVSSAAPDSHTDSRTGQFSSAAGGDERSLARRRYATGLVALIALPSAIQAVFYLGMQLRLIPTQNDVFFPEGSSVYAFLDALQTHRLYQSPFDFPWNAQLYGPLFYVVGTFVAWLCHGAPTAVTIAMRLFSFASYLGSVIVAGLLCWRLEKQKLWAITAVILGLGCFWLVGATIMVRADVPSILLALAALAVYNAAGPKPWPLFAAGALAVMSFLMKQTSGPVLLALAIDSLIGAVQTRKVKPTAALAAGAAGAGVLILAPLWLRHEPFLANFLSTGSLERSWAEVPGVMIAWVRVSQISVVAFFLALVGALFTWKEPRYRSVLLATALTWLSVLPVAAHRGSGSNPMILPWFLTMLFLPAGLIKLEQWSVRLPWASVALLLLAALIVVRQRPLLTYPYPHAVDPGPVASLTLLSGHPYLELRSRSPQFLDPSIYNVWSRLKVWSDVPMRRNVDDEVYDLILLQGADGSSGSDFLVSGYRGMSGWGADVLAEMGLHYRAVCETSEILALAPLDRPSPVSSAVVSEIYGEPCRETHRLPQVAPGFN
jgi:hypothetical protein